MMLFYRLLLPLFSCCFFLPKDDGNAKTQSWYFSSGGKDDNDGSASYPFQSLNKLNNLALQPGDTVFLKGGDIFSGSIHLIKLKGSANKHIIITSYNQQTAIIDAGNTSAVIADSTDYLSIRNIKCKGSGRKNGNTMDGIVISNSNHINIANVETSGFQKAGLLIYSSHLINADSVTAHDNGFAGISVSGNSSKKDCSNIHVSHCSAYNNPGDPTNFTNHSGNGIIAGMCTNVLIEYSTATNNGWDMPRIGNGPVGIWCYEADSVIIQHCISYENKTSKGGEDGGGYDLDGGTTNSIIQYCLSYRNQGSAFGIFQYAGASAWHNNTVRFCISEDDGNVSAAHANTYVWSSAHDSTLFTSFLFYNNTIYNSKGAALSYSVESDRSNFAFYNNIFVADNELIKGNYKTDTFIGNNWKSRQHGFAVDSNYNFINWLQANGKEQAVNVVKGFNIDPMFLKAGNVSITNADSLRYFTNYHISPASALARQGLNLEIFNINNGGMDFNGKPLTRPLTGACAY